MISFLGLGGEDIFIPAREKPLMLAIGGYLCEKSTGNSKEKRKYILPFDQKPPPICWRWTCGKAYQGIRGCGM